MKTCPQCGKQMLAESVGDGKTKFWCQSCGHQEVQDARGKKLLTDTMPSPDRRQVLTG